MGPIAKLAAVGVGGGALAVGGTYLWKHMSDVMPPWHSLAEDSDYSTKKTSESDYKDKFGATYGNYLVGISTATTGKEPKDNDPWWEWIYLNRFKKVESHKGKFQTVKQATGSDSNNLSLKAACTQAYKEKNKDSSPKIKSTGSPNSDEFLEEDVWKFCSPIGQKPTTLSDNKNATEKAKYSGKLGEDTTNVSKFISVEDPGNEIFWQIRQEEFFTENGSFSPKTSDTDNTFFKSFYDSEKSKQKDQRETIKEKCRAAYLTNKTTTVSDPQTPTTTNPSVDKIVKYCSLDGQ